MTSRQAVRSREGTRIISALEMTWAAIQERHPEVPDVVMITGTGRPRRGNYVKRGHHSPDRWVDAEAEGRSPELFIAGETLHDGPEAVLQTMLHEAAHALGHVRGIKNTSGDGNRWHNRKFATLATEMGLEPPKRAEKVLGFSNCLLTQRTAALYLPAVRQLESARLPYLDGVPVGTGGGGTGSNGKDDPKGKDGLTGGKRLGVECSCEPPRRIQLTPKVLHEGPVLCGLCGEPFTEPLADAAGDGS